MHLLTSVWIAMDIAVCLVALLSFALRNNFALPEFLKDLATWGKTREDSDCDDRRKVAWLENILLVPKRWFIHFYVCGVVWNWSLLLSFIQSFLRSNPPSFHGALRLVSLLSDDATRLDCFTVLLTVVLLTVQLSRRLYESIFISSFSGKMHLIHYFVGMAFYGMVNLSLIAEIPILFNTGWCSSCQKLSLEMFTVKHILAVSLFIWASYHQYKCHIILGKLTTYNPNGKKIYKIPHGDWFEYISSPHYFAEIIIYVALFIIMHGPSLRSLVMVLFVILNLSLGASITHEWYHTKFKSYPKRRWRIIPYMY